MLIKVTGHIICDCNVVKFNSENFALNIVFAATIVTKLDALVSAEITTGTIVTTKHTNKTNF